MVFNQTPFRKGQGRNYSCQRQANPGRIRAIGNRGKRLADLFIEKQAAKQVQTAEKKAAKPSERAAEASPLQKKGQERKTFFHAASLQCAAFLGAFRPELGKHGVIEKLLLAVYVVSTIATLLLPFFLSKENLNKLNEFLRDNSYFHFP